MQKIGDFLTCKDPVDSLQKELVRVWLEKKPLSEFARSILLVGIFESAVLNGGFSLLFWNESGDYSPQMALALKAVGAKRSYELLSQAINFYGANESTNSTNMRELIDKIPFNDLNFQNEMNSLYNSWLKDVFNASFSDSQSENLHSILLNYIRLHADELILGHHPL